MTDAATVIVTPEPEQIEFVPKTSKLISGNGSTVVDADVEALQPNPSVTVTPQVDAEDTVIVRVVSPVDHKYPENAPASKTVELPLQIAKLPVMLTTMGLTTTVTVKLHVTGGFTPSFAV